MKLLTLVFGFSLYLASAIKFDTSKTHFGLKNHFQSGTTTNSQNGANDEYEL
jgi:hypothetical protein